MTEPRKCLGAANGCDGKGEPCGLTEQEHPDGEWCSACGHMLACCDQHTMPQELADLLEAERVKRERDEARAELADHANSLTHALAQHPDEEHCACAPLLAARVSALEGALRLNGLDPDEIVRTDPAAHVEMLFAPNPSRDGLLAVIQQAKPEGLSDLDAALNVIGNHAATIALLTKERDELQATFDLQYAADMRAIEMFKEAHPDYPENTWPDRAVLFSWVAADRAETLAKLDDARKHLPFEHADGSVCPTFYDGCHCTLETLRHNIERAERLEGERDNAQADRARAEAERDAVDKKWRNARTVGLAALRALRPFALFYEKWQKAPLSGLGDTFYQIHAGTEFGAALKLSDCKAAHEVTEGG